MGKSDEATNNDETQVTAVGAEPEDLDLELSSLKEFLEDSVVDGTAGDEESKEQEKEEEEIHIGPAAKDL